MERARALPADWRKEHLQQTEEVIILRHGEDLIIKPKKTEQLSTFFDSIKVDLENDLSDWHAIKRELLQLRKTQE